MDDAILLARSAHTRIDALEDRVSSLDEIRTQTRHVRSLAETLVTQQIATDAEVRKIAAAQQSPGLQSFVVIALAISTVAAAVAAVVHLLLIVGGVRG